MARLTKISSPILKVTVLKMWKELLFHVPQREDILRVVEEILPLLWHVYGQKDLHMAPGGKIKLQTAAVSLLLHEHRFTA